MQIELSKSPSVPVSEEPSHLSAPTFAELAEAESAIQAGRRVNHDSPSNFAERPESVPAASKDSATPISAPSATGSNQRSIETASSSSNPDSLVLSRFDQPTLVVLLLISSLAVIGWSLWQSNLLRSRTIDIDEARRSPLVFVVDLNETSATELANLPGVGPKLAEAIIAYRRERGRFSNAADLLNVSGIGEAKLKAILPYLRPLGPIIEPDSPPGSTTEVR